MQGPTCLGLFERFKPPSSFPSVRFGLSSTRLCQFKVVSRLPSLPKCPSRIHTCHLKPVSFSPRLPNFSLLVLADRKTRTCTVAAITEKRLPGGKVGLLLEPDSEDEEEKPIDKEGVQEEALRLLEWPLICKQVASFAQTPMGVARAEQAHLSIAETQAGSEALLAQTAAAALCELDFEGVQDCKPFIAAAVAKQSCDIPELCDVGSTLKAAQRLKAQLQEAGASVTPISDLLKDISLHSELSEALSLCLQKSPAKVLDSASEHLRSIRLQRKETQNALEKLLKSIGAKLETTNAFDRLMIDDRRDRMCILIRATHRAVLPKGVVLDTSNTGATLYMEPVEALPLNNRATELALAEAEEESKVLTMLTSQVAESAGSLLLLLDRLETLDLAKARARHSAWLGGTQPRFNNTPSDITPPDNNPPSTSDYSICLREMRHPVLLASALKGGQSLPQAIDILVYQSTKVVAITGPNTGGKTATLKTAGSAAIMAKAGLFIPARDATFPWFDQVLADIGDEQSLEQSLSTFSGHIRRLCRILKNASRSSLVLLDEAGSGTDPSEGAALAASILKHLANKSALTIATTHYSELKILKAEDPRFENASVEFDPVTLRPTYRVLWGVPGQSNALAIARALGFDKGVLEEAEKLLSQLAPAEAGQRASFLLGPLMDQQHTQKQKAEAAMSALEEVKLLHSEISSQATNLSLRETNLRKKQEEDVRFAIKTASQQMAGVVRGLQESLEAGGATPALSEVNNRLAMIAQSFTPDQADLAAYISAAVGGEAEAGWVPGGGERVLVRRLGNKPVTVAEPPDDRGELVIELGSARVKVHLSQVLPLPSLDYNGPDSERSSKPKKATMSELAASLKRRSYAGSEDDGVEIGLDDDGSSPSEGSAQVLTVQTASNTVDLRGLRVSEAEAKLERVLTGRFSGDVLFVIHGLGTGAVKQAALDLLVRHPLVAKVQQAEMNLGCTMAFLKS